MKKGITTLSAVIATVVVMVFLGVGGWYYLDQSWKSDRSLLENQVKSLETSVTKIEAQNDLSRSEDSEAVEINENVEQNDNLSTYISEKYGYSFQYPSNFSLVDWFWDDQNNLRIPQNGKVVWVGETNLPENAIPLNAGPVSQYYSVTVNEDSTTGFSALRGDGAGVTITEVTIGGAQGWKALRTEPEEYSGNYSTSYYVNHNNNVYSMQIVNSDAVGTHDQKVDDMIESFTFR